MAAVADIRSKPNEFDSQAWSNAAAPKERASSIRPALASLAPVTRGELCLDTRHVGRVLRGKVITPALAMASAMALVEDERGRLLKLAVYNCWPPGAAGQAKVASADALLPEGASVAVLEPFYKRFVDGTFGVRVDDPRDLVLLSAPAVRVGVDHVALKEQGNTAFRAGRLADAELRYTEALCALTASGQADSSALSPILANLAAALLSMGGDEGARSALLAASAAAAVDKGYPKAHFRAAAACKALGDGRHTHLCVEKTRLLGAGGASCDALLADAPLGLPGNESSFALAVSAAADSDLHTSLNGRSPSGAEVAAAVHKARGNELFSSGQFAEAADAYAAALQQQRHAAATLLCNRAVVRLELERPSAALLDSLASLTLQPATAKAHYRRVLALRALQSSGVSIISAIARGLRDCPGDGALLQLQQRFCDNSDVREQRPRASGARRSDFKARITSERELHQKVLAASVDVEESVKMNAMLAALPAESKAKLREAGIELDERVQPFHTEFERARTWPACCDMTKCRLKLLVAYEHCREASFYDSVMLMHPGQAPSSLDLISRLGSNLPGTLMWWQTAESGAVRDHDNNPFDPRVFKSFSNADSSALIMTPGTAHVAVGFVDLGTLRDASFDTDNAQTGPVRWVGVEASAYAVAKTTVVDAMLRSHAPLDAILEVWYSAAWSDATLAVFRAAVDEVRQRGGADNGSGTKPRHSDVAAILALWSTATVPLARARAAWLEDNNRTWFEIGNFARAKDRLALCAYVLTGQLLDGATVGSVCMFAPLPSGFEAKRALGESIFHVVPVDKLWRRRRSGAANIVDAATEYLRRGVQRIRDRVTTGEVTIELWLEHLSPENSAALSRVSALLPFSMSWSNFCDYMTFADFHAVARACSAPGGQNTVHYGYSMNWTRYTKGCSVLDYISMPGEDATIVLRRLRSSALETMGQGFDKIGAKPYLLWPPVSDLRNHVDWYLRTMMEPPMDFCIRWADTFLAAACLEDPEKQVGVLRSALMYGHLMRCHGVMHFSYTYDPQLRLIGILPSAGEPALHVSGTNLSTEASSAAPQARVCAGCAVVEADGAKYRFRKCSRCMCAYFCSVDCQRAAWGGAHKKSACDVLRRDAAMSKMDSSKVNSGARVV